MIVSIDITDLVPFSEYGSKLTPAVSFESTIIHSVPVDVGGRASHRGLGHGVVFTLVSAIHLVTSPCVSPSCHHICYAIVHSHEREGSQRQHTECPNYGTLLRAVAAIFYEGLRHRHD